jgi:hypothetical protein
MAKPPYYGTQAVDGQNKWRAHTPASISIFQKMQMPIHVRTRNGGKSYALRIKHAGLPQPAYLTFDSEAEARRAGELAEAALNRGDMPLWLQAPKESAYNTIADVVRAYLRSCEIAASTSAVLDTVLKDVGACQLGKLNYDWAEAWVQTGEPACPRHPSQAKERPVPGARLVRERTSAEPGGQPAAAPAEGLFEIRR